MCPKLDFSWNDYLYEKKTWQEKIEENSILLYCPVPFQKVRNRITMNNKITLPPLCMCLPRDIILTTTLTMVWMTRWILQLNTTRTCIESNQIIIRLILWKLHNILGFAGYFLDMLRCYTIMIKRILNRFCTWYMNGGMFFNI